MRVQYSCCKRLIWNSIAASITIRLAALFGGIRGFDLLRVSNAPLVSRTFKYRSLYRSVVCKMPFSCNQCLQIQTNTNHNQKKAPQYVQEMCKIAVIGLRIRVKITICVTGFCKCKKIEISVIQLSSYLINKGVCLNGTMKKSSQHSIRIT